MHAYAEKIREIAARLLGEGRVERVIGFRRGTIPLMNEPCVVAAAGEVGQLVWDSHCGINLANYLTDRKEKLAVVAKGCDSRNIVTHIIENKIKREQLYIIGVPCQGMVDRHRVALMAPGEVQAVSEAGGQVKVSGEGFEREYARAELLQANCKVCHHRNPAIYDELVGELVAEQPEVDRYEDVRAIEALASEAKWAFFEQLLAPCIRCYACRNACPLCYCPSCFVDESRPQWVGKGADAIDTRTFHFLRAYHCAGRCTDCGACERACPVGINMRVFTKKLEKDCREQYGWEAGLTLESRPPLDVYRADDPGAFIK